MSRSIVVVSKFDNRVKEFEEKWEIDQYLSASGYLPDHAKPFFVALPKDRAFKDNASFRGRIVEVDQNLQTHMRKGIQGGFDQKYAPQVGFPQLKLHLETELQRRYAKAVPQVLSLLSQRGNQLKTQAEKLEKQLEGCSDVRSVRTAGMKQMHRILSSVLKLLHGAGANPDPANWGLTSEEEWAAFSHPVKPATERWPGVSSAVNPPHSGLKMYGGAAFDRAVAEFQCAANSLPMPKVRFRIHSFVCLRFANAQFSSGFEGKGGQYHAKFSQWTLSRSRGTRDCPTLHQRFDRTIA